MGEVVVVRVKRKWSGDNVPSVFFRDIARVDELNDQ
jgi:hypothetical protein